MAKHVAVMIDDVVLRTLLCETIELNGFEPTIVFPSDRAIEELRESAADALILDVRLKEQEPGWSLLHLVRRDPTTADLAVILLTADEDRRKVQRRTTGMANWHLLRKPFGFVEISTVLTEALAVPR
jgi:DNA-binding response OmpR family regulator